MEAELLPEIRKDLKIFKGSPDEIGMPRWLLFDPVANKYYSLSLDSLNLLNNWQANIPSESFLDRINEGKKQYEQNELNSFVQFLSDNHLVKVKTNKSIDGFLNKRANAKRSWLSWLVHHYLFIKVPLFRPDNWLGTVVTNHQWIFSQKLRFFILLMGLTGTALIIKQWEQFHSTFLYFFNWNGFVFYAITLILIKSAHELGHALTSKKLGCNVASMGVALLVMFPVLYTDTTDSWKLRSKKQRLKIVTAGVKTELYIAMAASFLWAVLPDGTLRSAAFFLATTSWITSLLINISPFLRFDGYYAFSDLIGIENLQQRSFAFGKWRLRKWLWGLNEPAPEFLPQNKIKLLTAYAWCTWIYRFVLFVGIALLVYHFFFKALGTVLFLIEIWWFILMPIIKEAAVWRSRWRSFTWSMKRVVAWGSIVCLMLWLVLPFERRVELPAVMETADSHALYLPVEGFINSINVTVGDFVNKGDVLLTAMSPELEHELSIVEKQIQSLKNKLGKVAGSDQERVSAVITQQKMNQLFERKLSIENQLEKLIIKSPIAGKVVYLEDLSLNQWLSPKSKLIKVVQPKKLKVTAYLEQNDRQLLSEATDGIFIANSRLLSSTDVVLKQIEMNATSSISHLELSSVYGGEMASRIKNNDSNMTEKAHYKMVFDIKGTAEIEQSVDGVVILDTNSFSLLSNGLKHVLGVMRRELSF